MKTPEVPVCKGSGDKGSVEREDGSLLQLFLIGVQGEKLERERNQC